MLWETSGTGTFNDASALDAIYTPSADDYTNGMVVLTITVFGDGGAELSDEMELTFILIPVVPENIVGPFEVCSGYTYDYEVEEIEHADLYNWVITPEEAGEVAGDGSVVSITWNVNYVGDATLKVRGENDCGEGEFSEELDIMVFICTGIEESNNQVFSVLPNPNNGIFRISFNSNESINHSIKLLDIMGKMVYEKL